MRLALFVSGTGTNLQAILESCRRGDIDAAPVVVVGNNSKARSMSIAQEFGVPTVHLSSRTHPEPDDLDSAILQTLVLHEVDLVVLAGYAKQMGPKTIAAYRNRIVNTHPGPLPLTGGPGMFGLAVHQKVITSGLTESAITVHLVDEDYDSGPVIATASVPVMPGDTAESLAERLKARENHFLPETLARIAAGELHLPD